MGMKYIPDAVEKLALLSIALPIIIFILVGLWVARIFFRGKAGIDKERVGGES